MKLTLDSATALATIPRRIGSGIVRGVLSAPTHSVDPELTERMVKKPTVTVTPLSGIAEIRPGDDLGALLCEAIARSGLQLAENDILVVAQKVVSKAENLFVALEGITPSPQALDLAKLTEKDARLVELILSESTGVIRAAPQVLIVRHRLGFVMANAGIDRSNVDGGARLLLLPRNPDGSAKSLREAIAARTDVPIGVIISDSFGRPWRRGVTNVALGAAGLPAVIDRRGESDRNGRTLESTIVGFADLAASAAGLVMGEGAEGIPAVLIQGVHWDAPKTPASDLIRSAEEDLFT